MDICASSTGTMVAFCDNDNENLYSTRNGQFLHWLTKDSAVEVRETKIIHSPVLR
jgi:hypothetical protein